MGRTQDFPPLLLDCSDYQTCLGCQRVTAQANLLAGGPWKYVYRQGQNHKSAVFHKGQHSGGMGQIAGVERSNPNFWHQMMCMCWHRHAHRSVRMRAVLRSLVRKVCCAMYCQKCSKVR